MVQVIAPTSIRANGCTLTSADDEKALAISISPTFSLTNDVLIWVVRVLVASLAQLYPVTKLLALATSNAISMDEVARISRSVRSQVPPKAQKTEFSAFARSRPSTSFNTSVSPPTKEELLIALGSPEIKPSTGKSSDSKVRT
ncbi:hypothetical protein D3C81_1301590 [compost metagenome]